MSYKEKVQNKIQSFERTEERTLLWEEICSAYEEGGVEQVEARIAEKVDSFKTNFDAAVKKLQQML